ncbi:hypothetical protein PROFUN_14200 [Planoprotostelium fungivorum]|uniref:Pentatricopeptide repeat-containing protein n=1 Tax=Planoprotostelium fungivorum TaxID=1890364 RepID=A0A2P6N368_9EUKA|nr:hypothetical protein PROFUN_14200 [Planoprotostelium fungivorum]
MSCRLLLSFNPLLKRSYSVRPQYKEVKVNIRSDTSRKEIDEVASKLFQFKRKDDAIQIMSHLRQKDTFNSRNALSSWARYCTKTKDEAGALQLMKMIQNHPEGTNTHVYNHVIQALATCNRPYEAYLLLVLSHPSHFQPNGETWQALFRGASTPLQLSKAIETSFACGYRWTPLFIATIVSAYYRLKRQDEAREYFKVFSVSSYDQQSWDVILTSCIQNGYMDEGTSYLHQMDKTKKVPSNRIILKMLRYLADQKREGQLNMFWSAVRSRYIHVYPTKRFYLAALMAAERSNSSSLALRVVEQIQRLHYPLSPQEYDLMLSSCYNAGIKQEGHNAVDLLSKLISKVSRVEGVTTALAILNSNLPSIRGKYEPTQQIRNAMTIMCRKCFGVAEWSGKEMKEILEEAKRGDHAKSVAHVSKFLSKLE